MNKKICIMLMFFVFIFWNVSCQSGLGGLLNRGAETIRGGAEAINRGVEDIREVINDDQNPVGRVINDQNVRDDVSAAQEDFTPEQEYYIGRAVAANILSQYRLWNGNPALTAYLNNICAAITINSNPPEGDVFNGYHVAILDSTEINAFATSGGHILITRGLIGAAKSEDALAAVIAHEVAHIQLKHSLKAINRSRWTQAGISGIRALLNMNNNDLTKVFADAIGDIGKTLLNDGYSRATEEEADNTAMSLLAGAGYNPSALIDMLRELNTVQRAGIGFGKTHPTPAQRIANAEKSVGRYPVVNTGIRQARFNTLAR